MLQFIQENWDLVSSNPLAFITIGCLAAMIGFAFGCLLSKHRIDFLKDQLDVLKECRADLLISPEAKPSAPDTFLFPDAGFHGKNILATITTSVVQAQTVSMSALVPLRRRLRVRLKACLRAPILEEIGAWTFSVGPKNWQHTVYDSDQSEQWFEAGPGECDMRISFHRLCIVEMSVYESDSREPTWTKDLQIKQH